MDLFKVVEMMVEDYCQGLNPPPTEIEKKEYHRLAHEIHNQDNPSEASLWRIEAFLRAENLITRTIHCPHCHASYYYDPEFGFDVKCYHCGNKKNLELNEVCINQIPPWIDTKSHVWYC